MQRTLILLALPLTLAVALHESTAAQSRSVGTGTLSGTVLVTVELSEPSAAAFFHRLHPRVYYASTGWALIELTPAQIELARRAGHSVTIIDSHPDPDSYRLISKKRAPASRTDIAGADVLLERGGILITRGEPSIASDQAAGGLKAVPLRPRQVDLDPGNVVGSPVVRASTDSLISSIVARVNPDSVRWFIQHLQDFKTRYAYDVNRDDVAGWIQAQFRKMGYADARRDSFSYGGVWHTNVVATLPGRGTSGQIIVFGGHHDSNSGQKTLAPGADDNASGTTAALEAARVLSQAGFTPEVTIKFTTFAAEEIGLVGSAVNAARSEAAGTKIKLMINHDMIANNPGPYAGSPVLVYYYTGAEVWRDLAMQTTDQFSALVGHRGGANSGGSDSYSFWARGYPAIYFFEEIFSPVYHSPADTIGNINIDYCAEVIRASTATMLRVAAMPDAVRGLEVADRGDGSSLLATWRPGADGSAVGYRVFLGTTSGSYDSSFVVTDTSAIIGGLGSGTLYYVGIAAVDADGDQSLTVEKSGTPRLFPLAPADFAVSPTPTEINLRWRASHELDLLGYTVYRSETPGEQGYAMNAVPLRDTSYTDRSVQRHFRYYYTVRSLDSSLTESLPTPQIRSRLVSLDLGVLLVDESADSLGAPGNPSEQEVDAFYDSLLSGIGFTPYDVRSEGGIGLGDMGAYSTVVWFSDDQTDVAAPLAAQEDVQKYLEYGGKLLFAGFRPTRAFTGNGTAIQSFRPEEFMYSVFGIRGSELRTFSRFSDAAPIIGPEAAYPPVWVDSVKAGSVNGYHLRLIENIFAAPGATEIYSYGSGYDSSSLYGGSNGKPVGVQMVNQTYTSVVVSFPLYYMKHDGAQAFVKHVVEDVFHEVTAVEEAPTGVPVGFVLEQNYPNPFNPTTIIKFQLPVGASAIDRAGRQAGEERNSSGPGGPAWATLTVHDILGREIAVLVNEPKAPGSYVVNFDARGLASGIYFYRLTWGPFTQSRKMIVLQ